MMRTIQMHACAEMELLFLQRSAIMIIAAIAGVIVGRGTMDQTHPLRLTQTGQACRKVI
jgi:hypothetical protein